MARDPRSRRLKPSAAPPSRGGAQRRRPDAAGPPTGGRWPGSRQGGHGGQGAKGGEGGGDRWKGRQGGGLKRPAAGDAHGRREHGGRRSSFAPTKPALWTPGPGARIVRAEAGQRLASFVTRMHPELSVRGARRLIDDGACRINGRIETFGSHLLAVGDVVEVFLPEEPREHLFDPARIVYDADGILGYDKPAWLPVTPVEGPKSWSLQDILAQHLPPPIIPVHRLDADTSGVVLFARTERLARQLEARFKDHEVRKTYHAIVRGHPRATGERSSYLVKVDSGKGFERWRTGRGPDAREAITTWEVEERLGTYASLVRIMPKTGRYHQIRIHFSEMGHPIYGDRVYGDRQDPVHCGRHLLHASLVQLPSADGKGEIEIRARMPREFASASRQLRAL